MNSKSNLKVLVISINNIWRYPNTGVDQIVGYLRKDGFSVDIKYYHKKENYEQIINDLDLDIGVGKTTITSKITGNSTIDIGIGSLSLNLIGNNYTFKVNKGIGKVVIDNKEAGDNEVLGVGSNTIKLNGGIGDTTVTLNKDR